MKKLAIALVFIFLTGCSFGQMMFNNIRLGVPYHNFKLELQKKGFDYRPDSERESENIFSYTGKFIEKDVELRVMVTPKTKTVWRVNVELPESVTWADLKRDFFDLVEKLSQKYGLALQKKAFFSKPYSDGDGNELLAIFQKKCKYVYSWKPENGIIGIEIISYKEGTALINIWYEDKNASALYSAEKNQVIQDGL